MESPDIVLDLNGYTIQMTELFALQQRFFAVIELADQPFIKAQGPAPIDADGSTFGGEVVACSNCVIKNGILGRSAHHGIHGHSATGLLIKDLLINDYEVAAISGHGI